MFGALPDTFPEGSVQNVIRFITGGTDKWTAIESAYDLLGFGLHMLRGPSATLVQMSPQSINAAVPSDDVVANDLKALCERVRNGPVTAIEDEETVSLEKATSEKSTSEKSTSEKSTSEKPAPSKTLIKTSIPVQLPDYFIAFILRFLTKYLTT